MAGRGWAWRGKTRQVEARLGEARQDKVHHRRSDMGVDGFMRRGSAGLDRAREGRARRGSAWPGNARQGVFEMITTGVDTMKGLFAIVLVIAGAIGIYTAVLS